MYFFSFLFFPLSFPFDWLLSPFESCLAKRKTAEKTLSGFGAQDETRTHTG